MWLWGPTLERPGITLVSASGPCPKGNPCGGDWPDPRENCVEQRGGADGRAGVQVHEARALRLLSFSAGPDLACGREAVGQTISDFEFKKSLCGGALGDLGSKR